jgi:phosphoribosyl-ATP pyrophosphohydrolase/phosphoribosyl-AMP cyclohydrolase
MADSAFIERLETLIRSRIEESSDQSYTAKLASGGILAVAQKVGEEGVELALAGVAQSEVDVLNESADLIYHLLVLLALRGISFASVVETLEQRHLAQSAK